MQSVLPRACLLICLPQSPFYVFVHIVVQGRCLCAGLSDGHMPIRRLGLQENDFQTAASADDALGFLRRPIASTAVE
jgi:hypothetical protein